MSRNHTISGQISRKLLQIAEYFLLGAYRKVAMSSRLVNGDVTDDVTWHYDVIVVTSQSSKCLLNSSYRIRLSFNTTWHDMTQHDMMSHDEWHDVTWNHVMSWHCDREMAGIKTIFILQKQFSDKILFNIHRVRKKEANSFLWITLTNVDTVS